MTAAFRPRTAQPVGLLETLAARFLQRLEARGFARNTVIAYRTDLEQFVGWAQQLRGIAYAQHVSAGVVNDWIDYLVHGMGLQPRSAARKLETVKRFLRHCAEARAVTDLDRLLAGVEPVRYTFRPRTAPDMAAYGAFFDAITGDGPIALRDRALFRLLLDTGLRLGGVVSLDLYTPGNPPVWTVRPSGVVTYRKKGGATGDCVITDDATQHALAAWLEARHWLRKQRGETALFLNQRGGRMSRHAVHERCKRYGRLAGMPWLHAHLLRHSRLGDIMGRGDLHLAHYQAGHAHKSTTADMYGHFGRENMRQRLRNECPMPAAESTTTTGDTA